jgi:hypothetical protein
VPATDPFFFYKINIKFKVFLTELTMEGDKGKFLIFLDKDAKRRWLVTSLLTLDGCGNFRTHWDRSQDIPVRSESL